MFMATKVSNC